MSVNTLAFIPGTWKDADGPLSRFLPPNSQGVGQAWLKKTVQSGGWILDPFATDPYLALETARAGYPLLIAANNPITRFLLEMLAVAPSQEDFQSALAELGASRKGDDRLEHILPSLYVTKCAACDWEIQAQSFLWERDAAGPFARIYTCPHCGDSGERPVTETDLEQLRRLPPAGLHRSRALERVASIDDPVRADVELAVNCYLPRALYVIFTLVNKLDASGLSPARRALLTSLLLVVLDEGSSLWTYPAGRLRPKQLTVPPRFYENNLWLSLEKAVQIWGQACSLPREEPDAGPFQPVKVKIWPEQGEPGEITIFEGRYKDLAEQIKNLSIQGVLTVIPRPNQAYWTLSAVWAGWLWGRERVSSMKSVLSRRRYDWGWQAAAVQSTLTNLTPQSNLSIPGLGILAEVEPPFLAATLLGIQNAGLRFEDMAVRSDPPQAQIHFQTLGLSGRPGGLRESLCKTALSDFLAERGEPSPYLPAFAAILSVLGSERALLPHSIPEQVKRIDPGEQMSHLQAAIHSALNDRSSVDHFLEREQNLEAGAWWLHDAQKTTQPLSDRVEMEVVRFLQRHPGCLLLNLDRAICAQFPGWMTPPADLIRICLESYGQLNSDETWELRSEDQPAARRKEMSEIQSHLVEIGRRLGYQVEERLPIRWMAGNTSLTFCVVASSLIGRYLLDPEYLPDQSILVFPGGRSNLVSYKIQNDPRLEQAVQKGWKLIKFRYLRQLIQDPGLNQETWLSQLNGDPLEFRTIPLRI
ncbi:MAG TPA: hypothetical protein VMT46_17510 [Anaerolineaceae bacterium]|nr:hypothetical protein [Anaerolineaceae bacterium]